MSLTYSGYNALKTPQSQPIPGTNQVQNEAGGFGFELDDWSRLYNFLILGAEGGTYYVGEQTLVRQNAQAVERCIKSDGTRVVNLIVEISDSGRAPKNEPALFALAMAIGLGDVATRQAAAQALPKVARTGTHLLHFVAYAKQFRGFGPVLKRAVAAWFTNQNIERLQYELIKYPSRDKWAMRDLLRLSHPKAGVSDLSAVLRYSVHGRTPAHDKERSVAHETAGRLDSALHGESILKMLWAVEQSRADYANEQIVAGLVRTYNLPREAIPTEYLTKREVWSALLDKMPLTAMIRNLANMTRVGLLDEYGSATQTVVGRLSDQEYLRRSRVHPITILTALRVYAQGKGEKSSNAWTPVTRIIDALDRAFYASFDNVTPTGKRFMIGLDISGSMRHTMVNGLPFMSCIDAQSAMALVTASVEPNYSICAFDTVQKPLTISPRQRLDDVIKAVSRLVSGGTDCTVPIKVALDKQVSVDCFVIYTDSESWAGDMHVVQALKQYRQKVNPMAKMVIAQMAATKTTLADAGDAGCLQLAGLDASGPSLISEFATR